MRTEAERRRRKNRLTLLVGVLLAAVLVGGAAIFGPKIYNTHFDEYRNWPVAGTQTPDQALRPNIMLAVTCDDGRPEVKEYSLGDEQRWEGEPFSILLDLFAPLDAESDGSCRLLWDPMSRSYIAPFTPITLGQDGLWHLDEPERTHIGDPAPIEAVAIRKDGIAVFLLTMSDLKPGPEILNGPNGVPAPSRNLLES